MFIPPEMALNEVFACAHAACGKTFRKHALLLSHMRHYHAAPQPPRVRACVRACQLCASVCACVRACVCVCVCV